MICNAFGANRALAARHEDAIAKMMHKTCSNRPISKKHDAMRLSKHGKEAGSMASRGAIEARQDAMVKRRAAILKMEGEITRFLVAETFIVADSTAGKDLVALWQADLIRKLWAKNERLKRRVETQQGMIDWLRAQKNAPTAEQVAEQIFREAGNGG